MKYIRKKDGTIVKLKPHRFYKHVLEGDKLYLSGKKKILYISNVVSHADTIEELCDMYVIKYDSMHHSTWIKLENAMGIAKKQKHIGIAIENIFGAIWTDKGLIYVAKMNEKGELELL